MNEQQGPGWGIRVVCYGAGEEGSFISRFLLLLLFKNLFLHPLLEGEPLKWKKKAAYFYISLPNANSEFENKLP